MYGPPHILNANCQIFTLHIRYSGELMHAYNGPRVGDVLVYNKV